MVATASTVGPTDMAGAPTAMKSQNSRGPQSNGILKTQVRFITDAASVYQLEIAHRLFKKLNSARSYECEVVTLSAITSVDVVQGVCVFLPEVERSFLSRMSPEDFSICKHIMRSQRLLWVTKTSDEESKPSRALVTGLSRSVQSENLDICFVTLALQQDGDIISAVENTLKVLETMISADSGNLETEFREIDGRLCINRLTPTRTLDRYLQQRIGQPDTAPGKLHPQHLRKLKLTMKSLGSLDSFEFADIDIDDEIPAQTIDVEMKAAGLNFRDVQLALGHAIGDNLGMECSGIVKNAGSSTDFSVGDRVSCCVNSAFGTFVRCEAYAAVKIPDDMTFAAAAASPMIFLTAYYSIIRVAHMQHGESILIHSAVGGFGQVCVQTAKLFGAEIFATVRTAEKRGYHKEHYGLRDDHIFSSRTPDFATAIPYLTNGRGVDVIINSLSGGFLRKTWECIAPFGRIIEVGRIDFLSSSELPMAPFSRGASFVGLDLVHFRNTQKQSFRELMEAAMSLFVDGKYIVPRPFRIFKPSQIETAFRLLASGRNRGKVALSFDNENDEDEVVQVCLMTLGLRL